MYNMNDVTACYFNGSNLLANEPEGNDKLLDQIKKNLNRELFAILNHVICCTSKAKVFGLSPLEYHKINKLSVLKLAESLGFKIPKTRIVSKE
jgi:hypothetical protein